MPKMNLKASEITDPSELLERALYRTERLLTKLEEKEDPVSFVKLMAGHNKTDLKRALALLRGPAN